MRETIGFGGLNSVFNSMSEYPTYSLKRFKDIIIYLVHAMLYESQ